MKHADIQKLHGSGLVGIVLVAGLILCLAFLSGGCGTIPILPRQSTIPPKAANYEKVMAKAKIGQTTLKDLWEQLEGSAYRTDANGVTTQDARLSDYAYQVWRGRIEDRVDSRGTHHRGMYLEWQTRHAITASLGGAWSDINWKTDPGHKMLLLEFDENDRLKRFEVLIENDSENPNEIFYQWLKKSQN